MTDVRRGLDAVGWALRLLALATVVVRLLRGVRKDPPVRTGDVDGPAPPISIVIPARDEADRVGPAVVAARRAPGVVEVIVADDGSSDETAGVARRHGARVLTVGPPPAGWAGKPWAMQQGVERATGEWVVLLDADTRPAPGLPSALVARAVHDRTDLLSVAGRTRRGRPGATAVHGALLTTLVYRFGVPGGRARAGREIANGQCMAVRRHDALAWGGWTPVAASTIEDVALARWLARSGRRVAWLDATGALDVEPYPSARATVAGWGRSIGLAGVETRTRRLVDVVVVAFAAPVPLLRCAVGRWDLLDLAAVAVRTGTLVGMRRAHGRPTLAYWCSPLLDGVAVATLTADLFRQHETWRGRRIDRAATPGRTAHR